MSKIELLKPSPMSTSLYFDEKVVSVEGDGKTGTQQTKKPRNQQTNKPTDQ